MHSNNTVTDVMFSNNTRANWLLTSAPILLYCYQALLCSSNQPRRTVLYIYIFIRLVAYMLWEEL